MPWLCRRRIAFEERWLVAYHVFISHNNHTTLIHVFSQGSWCSFCVRCITNTKSVFYDRIACIILSIKEITYHFSEAKKKNRRKPSKNQSIPEKLGENTVPFVAMAYLLTFCWVVRVFFPDATPSGDLDEGIDEDNSSVKSIGIFKDKKPKKKKVRKVLSWNF